MSNYKLNMVGNNQKIEKLTDDQLLQKRNAAIECTITLSATKLRHLESFYSPDEDYVMDFAKHKDCDAIVQDFINWFIKTNSR